MKKVITICLLVITLLVGGTTIDAKTAKKKSTKAKTSLTVLNFVKSTGRGYCVPYNTSILTSHGYKYLGEDMWGDSKGNIVDSYESFEGSTRILIQFKNIAERDKFMKGWEKFFEFVGKGTYLTGGAHDTVTMEVDGTTVTIQD